MSHILDNLYKHSMVHPDVAAAYSAEKEVPKRILLNEVPDTSLLASYDPSEGSGDSKYLTFTATTNSTISLESTMDYAPDLEYSTDGGNTWETWDYVAENNGGSSSSQSYTSGSVIPGRNRYVFDEIALSARDSVMIRGNNNAMSSWGDKYSSFIITGQVRASGNVMSLLGEGVTVLREYGFRYLFRDCTGLLTAPNMSTCTSIGWYGCENMYEGCTSLEKAPNFPKNLGSLGGGAYNNMFVDCNFNMSDDGVNFNFEFPEFPFQYQKSGSMVTYNSAFLFAEDVLGNSTGLVDNINYLCFTAIEDTSVTL